MQQQHKGLRPKRTAVSRKQESIQQDRQADFRSGGLEASSRDFHQVIGSERLDIMEGFAPSEMKEETTSSLRARDVGALITLRTSVCTDWKEL
jgi:hypothetical protein